MRRLIAALVVLMVAGAAAAAGQAATSVHLKNIDNSFSFTIPAGDVCAFDVTFTVGGTGNVTLLLNDSGQVVQEIDTFPGEKVSYSGNGKSFSYSGSGQTVKTDYGSGATLGG